MGLFFSSFFLVLGWITVEEIMGGGFVRLGEVGTFMTIMMKWLGIGLFAEQAQQLSQVIGRFLFPSGFFNHSIISRVVTSPILDYCSGTDAKSRGCCLGMGLVPHFVVIALDPGVQRRRQSAE